MTPKLGDKEMKTYIIKNKEGGSVVLSEIDIKDDGTPSAIIDLLNDEAIGKGHSYAYCTRERSTNCPKICNGCRRAK